MKYIDRIDNNFIFVFVAENFPNLLKDAKVHLEKKEDYWKLTSEKQGEEKDIIYFSDYSMIFYALNEDANNQKWQSALYKKFGKDYLTCLRDKLKNDELKKYIAKCNVIDSKIEEIKHSKNDDKIK